MKTIKRIFVTRTRWILLVSAIIAVASLISYAAFAQAHRGEPLLASKESPVPVASAAQIVDLPREPLDNESNPEFLKLRREWLDQLYGTGRGTVPPEAFAKALAAARALPPSLLLYSPRFMAPQTASTWTFPVPPPLANDWGGGASARIDAIAVDPTNADIVYTGSEGGLAKSTDGGEHWTYLSDGLLSQSIRSLAVDPIAPNIIYAGTGTNQSFGVGIYRSVNSGATWTLFGNSQFSGRDVVRIAIDPATAGSQTSTTLYVSVVKTDRSHQIWKSTNSGSSWTQIRSATGGPWWGGYYPFYDIAIDPADPLTIYVTAPDGVFKKAVGGNTWVRIHDIPDGPAPSCLAIAQSVLYLAYKHGNTITIKSTDQGSTWTSLNPSGGELWCFGVDPAHANRIFVGGGGDLRYSLDGGNTWLSSQNVHVDNHWIVFCPTNSQRNYLGTDGGIYRADYPGSGPMTWTSKNQNLPGCLMQGISIGNDDHIVMGNQDNGTQLGWAGRNPPWMMVCGGDGGGKPQIDQNDSNKFYYPGLSYGQRVCVGVPCYNLARWVNGVKTDITPPGACGENQSYFPPLFAAAANSARVTAGFQNVWRSLDSGGSWTRIGGRDCSIDPNDCGIDRPSGVVQVVYEAPSNSDIIYAITAGGAKIFVTSNAGQGNNATWTNRTSGLPGGINGVAVHPSDPQTAYVACNAALYKTTNLGVTWVSLSAPANAAYRDVAIDPANPNQVFVASFAGVFASTNAGTTWTNMSTGIPAGMAVMSLSFNGTSRQLAAATYGRGAYVLDLDDVPPTVTITAPPNGATVSGTVTVSADASDNHKVVGVQFKLNGTNLGSEDTSPPYSIVWNTVITDCGSRTLTAVARDPASNTRTSTPVMVTVNGPCSGK